LQFLLENGKKRAFSYEVALKNFHGRAKGGASHRGPPPKYATVEGTASEELDVSSGVPQGSVFGPYLFLFYISDIAEGLSSTDCLFADDTVIYMAVKNDNDAAILQKDLDLLCDWEAKWKMEFHPDKCEILSITRKKSPVVSDPWPATEAFRLCQVSGS